jgi:maltose alpha-D-glucosyltransferase / alpha-amylase
MEMQNQEQLGQSEGPAQKAWRDDPLWYKDAIIYELHVKAFYDSNGDGIGDFPGLTEKLDYIKELGVNTIWLLPFYPSPLKDDGYDISDYRGVHPSYGTLADFRNFVREAHRRDLKIITELVINHTSDQHPWFQAARHAPAGSRKRDYYVWSETAKKWEDTRIIFTDTETSNWTWDPVAKAYYWHRFFSHQPDLNFNNPHVVRAVLKVMQYWFDMGVDGMRLDAIPYLCERDGTSNENLAETHAVLKHMRRELDKHYKNRFFLAEVNQWPEDVREYFGNGDECHMAYHFPLMPRIYMAVAEEDHYPILDIMSQTPEIPDNCQWACFLRNHDELTLEMVTERERDYMYRTYATDARARLNLGIRRRLAPLLQNNRRQIELVNSLLVSLVGSPIIYYGDEIGMGDNIYLGDRHGVRTPMQWSPDRNAGFSRADPQSLYLPPIMDPIYGYQAVNVEAQSRSPSSLLNWTRRMLTVSKAHVAFGRGALRFVRVGNRKILAYIREYGDQTLLCVANLSRSSQPAELDLREYKGRVPVELLGRTAFPPIGELPYLLTLPAWGFYWFDLATEARVPSWHDERPPRTELPILVIPEGLRAILTEGAQTRNDLRTLMARRMREQLERQVLPAFLASQRWFAGKGKELAGTELTEHDEWSGGAGNWLLTVAHVQFMAGARQSYSLPLSIAWEDAGYERLQSLLHVAVARVRQRARVGIVYDAFWDDAFCRAMVASMRAGEERRLPGGRLVFWGTSAFPGVDPDALAVAHPSFEQSNTMAILGNTLVLKGYRLVREGINPEIEIGKFLTEVSPFPNIAPLMGALEHVGDDGRTFALAVLHKYVENQGSGWNYTIEYLGRYLDGSLAASSLESSLGETAAPPPGLAAGAAPAAVGGDADSPHAAFLVLASTLGRRTGQMHVALAKRTGDPAFDPEPITADEFAGWADQVRTCVDQTLAQLAERRAGLSDAARVDADALLAARERMLRHVDRLTAEPVHGWKTRYHGDYHLGQVLLAAHDFVIVDFEGEPARPLAERRAKQSPLRDVAGMLRSFGYAAEVALDEATVDRPGDRARLVAHVAAWKREASRAFLSGYIDATHGSPAYPNLPGEARRLICLFMLDKALYEVRYELGSRPDWIRIPIAGLMEILGDDPPDVGPA